MGEPGHIPQPGDVLGGKYAIEGRLGEGGMGLVLAARNLRTNRRVAIKWLLPRLIDNPSALKRFEREAQVAGQINHPNVVNVYDVERDGPTLYIVMELLEGQSLADRLAGGRPLPLAEAAPLFMGVLRGVAAAHAAGVVHRDLKPDNVFVCRQPDGSPDVAKVLDFGISKRVKGEALSSITAEGAVIGTLQYMSPEQLRGQPTDERTDVYALGVILFKMLSAQLPFQGNNHIDLALNMASQPARALSDYLAGVPEGLDRAVACALTREADQRFASVPQFASALEPYFAGHALRAGSAAPRSLTPAPIAEPRRAPSAESFEATPFAADDQPQAEPPARARLRLPSFTRVIGLSMAAFGAYQYFNAFVVPFINRATTPAVVAPPTAEPASTRHSAQPLPKPRSERSARPRAPSSAEPTRARPAAVAEPIATAADAGLPTRRSQRAVPLRAVERPQPEDPEAEPLEPPATNEALNAHERPFRAGKPQRTEF